jgi:dihydrofolate synthase/folylpolyglutamate synthase
MQIFVEQDLDVILLEVGLGGRLDAVNLFDPDVALITVVDIDHTDWLGTDREQIAAEKAGILRRHKPVVCVDRAPPRALRRKAQAFEAPWYGIGSEFDLARSAASWDWRWGDEGIPGLPPPRLPGAHQYENAAGAIMALKCLGDELELDDEAVRNGIADAFLAGRFEVRAGPPEVVFDVAHNKQAARALAAELRRRECRGATRTLLAMLIDKDIEGVVEVLADVTDEWHVCGLAGPRGTSTERMVQAVERTGAGKPLHRHDDVESAYLRMCSRLGNGDRGVVCGSFLTVGEALRVEAGRSNRVGS